MAAADNLPVTSKKVDAQAALRENGYVAPGQSGSWWFQEDSEDTPELRWPWSVKVYDRMRRQDAKVKSVLRAVKSPLLSTTWRLEQGQASAEVTQHVSRDLGLPIKGVAEADQVHNVGRRRGRFSWPEHLRLALLMLDFGHSVFEQVYWLDEEAQRLHLRKLGPRFSASISKWNVARDGGLISVEQHAPGLAQGPSDVTMPVNRLVVYAHEREGADWWGQSLLRPAYKHWLIKDRLLRVDAQAIDRNGMGIPVHELDARLATGDGSGAPMDQDALTAVIDSGQEIAQAVRAGDNSGASLTPGAKLRLVGVEGQLPDALKSVLYHDDQIGTAVLAHFLNLGRQTGSWALGTTFQDFFVSSLTGTGNYVADVATQHIVEDLVDLNYGADRPPPGSSSTTSRARTSPSRTRSRRWSTPASSTPTTHCGPTSALPTSCPSATAPAISDPDTTGDDQ